METVEGASIPVIVTVLDVLNEFRGTFVWSVKVNGLGFVSEPETPTVTATDLAIPVEARICHKVASVSVQILPTASTITLPDWNTI